MIRVGPASRVLASAAGAAHIVLPESPTTGYRWELEHADGPVHVVTSTFDQASSNEMAGGGGVRRFHLAVEGPQLVDVAFVLRRPWEPEPIERRIVTIELSAQ